VQERRMGSSPPIGTTHIEYVKMLEEEHIGLSSCEGKKYPIHGMCPISSFTLFQNMYCIAPNACNPRCTLFPHLVFFPS